MKTIILRPPAGIGRDRTCRTCRRPLTADLAELVVADLAAGGILVAIHLGQAVEIEALVPLTTLQEVQALAALLAVTDSPLAWHGAVAR